MYRNRSLERARLGRKAAVTRRTSELSLYQRARVEGDGMAFKAGSAQSAQTGGILEFRQPARKLCCTVKLKCGTRSTGSTVESTLPTGRRQLARRHSPMANVLNV